MKTQKSTSNKIRILLETNLKKKEKKKASHYNIKCWRSEQYMACTVESPNILCVLHMLVIQA